MAKVLQIGISKKHGGSISKVNQISVIKGKGMVGDRKFVDNNDVKKQITLIEIENINFYNKNFISKINPVDFRRNIITEFINLNELLNKEFFVGSVKLKAHDLCRPCKYLETLLKQKDFVKKLILKGGLRCEILKSGKISVGDIIKSHD